MSKVEVKVKKGDRWYTASGTLYQHRGDKATPVADQLFLQDHPNWTPILSRSNPLSSKVARAWIESLGGTVVEEAEEVKGGTHTMHVYKFRSDGSLAFFDRKHQFQTADYLGTTIIHIAGVTA